jgi:hypothetical protein
MNMITTYGEYLVVYDGSQGFPDVKMFLITDRKIIKAGESYLFRVKALYQNGFTAYSDPSSPVFACSAPGLLLPPRLVAVSSSQMTLQWD